jgi:gliding motility-associated-like protein
MKLFSIFIISIFYSKYLLSQNLVVNGDFENHTNCPTAFENLTSDVVPWFNPCTTTVPGIGTINITTPDYFNSCSTISGLSVPTNMAGTEPAHSGNAYAGIATNEDFGNSPGNWLEYIETELSSPLIAGEKYIVSLWVSCAEGNPTSVTEKMGRTTYISALLTNSMVIDASSPIPIIPQFTSTDKIAQTNGWYQLTWTHTAIGGEKFLTIGNWSNDFGYSSPSSLNSNMAYYYIDDVSITRLIENELTVNIQTVASCEEVCNGSAIVNINNGIEPYTYSWLNLTTNELISNAENLCPGNYSLTVTDANGLISTNAFLIGIQPNANANFDWTIVSETSDELIVRFQKLGSEGQNWEWIFEDITFNNSQPSIERNYDLPQIEKICAKLIVTNEFGCKSTVEHCFDHQTDTYYYTPNSFTPDGDLFNNTFSPIISTEEIEKYDFRIYNRWGENIFSSMNPQESWSGFYKNEPCPDGIYTWTLQIKSRDLNELVSGSVTLLR